MVERQGCVYTCCPTNVINKSTRYTLCWPLLRVNKFSAKLARPVHIADFFQA